MHDQSGRSGKGHDGSLWIVCQGSEVSFGRFQSAPSTIFPGPSPERINWGGE